MEMQASPGGAKLDFARFRLRRFIDSLPPEELDRRSSPMDLVGLAEMLDGNTRAVMFEKAGPEGAQLAGNVCASRSRLALAFDSTPGEVTREVRRQLAAPQEVVEVPREQAPAQAVVLEDDAADLTALPVHLQHGLDGAPYVSASIDYSIDRDRGWTNIGMRPLMLRGRRETGVDLIAPSDLRAIYEAQSRRGEHVPVAFVVGAHPIDCVAATMRVPMDELALLASLRGAPLPVVKCVTNDIRVPADAEWVLEGYFDSKGYVEAEGPYYGVLKKNPVFRLTAITRRKDALFQTFVIAVRRHQASSPAKRAAERRFRGNGLRAGIDHAGANRRIPGPGRNRPPTQQGKFTPAALVESDHRRELRRGSVATGFPVKREGNAELQGDDVRVGTQGIAAAHAPIVANRGPRRSDGARAPSKRCGRPRPSLRASPSRPPGGRRACPCRNRCRR